MERILRYEVPVGLKSSMRMPRGAQIFYVEPSHVNRDGIAVWARVQSDVPAVNRTLFHIGSGRDPLPAGVKDYLGTIKDGDLTCHIFDGGESE